MSDFRLWLSGIRGAEWRRNGAVIAYTGGHNKAAPGGASTPLVQGPRRSGLGTD